MTSIALAITSIAVGILLVANTILFFAFGRIVKLSKSAIKERASERDKARAEVFALHTVVKQVGYRVDLSWEGDQLSVEVTPLHQPPNRAASNPEIRH